MQRLILFAKRPRAGRVKTRLTSLLGRRQTLGLYRAFLEDEWSRLERFARRASVEWCADGPWREPLAAGIELTVQGAGDLGQRLCRAFRRSHESGARATVVIGADSPTLPDDRIDDAFGRLEAGAELVVVPVEDGGYALIGLSGSWPELFRDVPWGGPEVLRVTCERARALGLRPLRLSPWYDVDDARGFARLCREYAATDFAPIAPRTARWLAERAGRAGPGAFRASGRRRGRSEPR